MRREREREDVHVRIKVERTSSGVSDIHCMRLFVLGWFSLVVTFFPSVCRDRVRACVCFGRLDGSVLYVAAFASCIGFYLLVCAFLVQ